MGLHSASGVAITVSDSHPDGNGQKGACVSRGAVIHGHSRERQQTQAGLIGTDRRTLEDANGSLLWSQVGCTLKDAGNFLSHYL